MNLTINPPAQQARRLALGLSAVAIAFSLGFGVLFRRWWAKAPPGSLSDFGGAAVLWLVGALLLLLIAVLLRIGAGLCELLWLERTWSNLPAPMRRVGPIDNVTPIHIFGIAFIPVVAWFWKLALVSTVSRSLELVRKDTPFSAPVPRGLGLTAVVLGWLPPLNLYVAPFLWELFARRIDVVYLELSRGGEGGPPS
jgi:hypothetical protein